MSRRESSAFDVVKQFSFIGKQKDEDREGLLKPVLLFFEMHTRSPPPISHTIKTLYLAWIFFFLLSYQHSLVIVLLFSLFLHPPLFLLEIFFILATVREFPQKGTKKELTEGGKYSAATAFERGKETGFKLWFFFIVAVFVGDPAFFSICDR